jgi:hypothetical protein
MLLIVCFAYHMNDEKWSAEDANKNRNRCCHANSTSLNSHRV